MAVTGYSRTRIGLHWLVLLLVIGQFVLHDGMVASYRAKVDTGVSNFTTLTVLHIAGGMLILIFAMCRLMLRQSRGAPPPPQSKSAVQAMVARAGHVGLYLLLILMPVTGVVAWAGPAGPAAGLHSRLRRVVFGLAVLHFPGALVGQFVQRTSVIGRMMKAAG